MDHLPRFKYSIGEYPIVPALSLQDYDGLPLNTYPQRRGFDRVRLSAADFSQHSASDTAAFLQTWLFFGALDQILSTDNSQKERTLTRIWIRSQSSRTFKVCTEQLNDRINAWAEHLNSLSQTQRNDALTTVNSCLDEVCDFSRICYSSGACPLPGEVTLSIKVLGCTLEHALQWFWDIQSSRNWEVKDTATARMIQSGWCLRDVSLANHLFSELPMFLASEISRPGLRHEDHSHCSERLCLYNQIDERTYRTKHVTEDCQCQHLKIDQEQVRQVLQKGEVPVISMTTQTRSGGLREVQVELKSFASYRFFIAISHVWSDGLGNPSRNSLPHCQLLALYDLLHDLYVAESFEIFDNAVDSAFEASLGKMNDAEQGTKEAKWIVNKILGGIKKTSSGARSVVDGVRRLRGRPINIWIDTLCVPLEKTYRKMAISGLKKVYGGAMYVLVLDSELQTLSKEVASEELLMRVALSAWMRRCWTFQEATLGNQRLRLKMADGVVNFPNILDKGWDPQQMLRSYVNGGKWGIEGHVADNWLRRYLKENQKRNLVKSGDQFEEYKKEWAEIAQQERKNFSISKYTREQAVASFGNLTNLWFLPDHEQSDQERALRIAGAWNSLVWRSTSREDDRFINFAFACVMDKAHVDAVLSIFDLPAHLRIKQWFLSMQSLPQGMPFVRGPRLDAAGLKWAPSTISQAPVTDPAPALRSLRGLSLKKPGLIIYPNATGLLESFVVHEIASSVRYWIQLDAEFPPMWANSDSNDLTCLGLILLHKPVGNEWVPGVLISIESYDESEIGGTFQCRVELQLYQRRVNGDCLTATALEGDQNWLVG